MTEAVQTASEVQPTSAQPEVTAAADLEVQADEATDAVVEQVSEVNESTIAEQLFQQLVALREKISSEVRCRFSN